LSTAFWYYAVLILAQIPLVASRHDTLSSPCILAQGKVVTCCVALVGITATRSSRQARLARHVFRGVATAWTGVDMSTLLFPEVVPEIDAKLLHASTTASSPSAMLEQARHDTHDKRDTFVTTRHNVTSRHVVRVMS